MSVSMPGVASAIEIAPRLTRRAVAVAGGDLVDDVARAGLAYAPDFGSLGVRDAVRARELVSAATASMEQPFIIVNRSIEGVDLLFERGREFPTSFDVGSARVAEYMSERLEHELRHGTHGSGPSAGRTVYGAVHFTHWLDEPNAAGELVRRNTGQLRYGEVGLELRPEAWRRATVLPNDSFYVDATPGTIEQLDDVVLERLLRNYHLVRDSAGASSPFDETASVLQDRFLTLVRGDAQVAVDQLQAQLRAPSTGRHYVEAQVRGVTLDDVVRVTLDVDPGHAPRWRPPAERDTALRNVDRIVELVEAQGLPIHVVE